MKREEQKRNSTEDLSEVYRGAASGELQSQNYRRNKKEDPITPPLDGPTEMQIKDVIYIIRNSTIFFPEVTSIPKRTAWVPVCTPVIIVPTNKCS